MDAGIGRRIAYWRTRRRMTQSDFGALMGGRTARWVQLLEAGARQSDPRLSVLESAAGVLRIPLEWLLRTGPETASVDLVELEAIRSVLQRHDVVTGWAGDEDADPPDVEAVCRRVAHGWDTFQAGSLGSLGRLVPGLLVTASRAAAGHTGHAQRAAHRELAMAWCLAEATAVKGGDGELACLAGHRAVLAAERGEDPAVMATAARHLADAMTHHGQPAAAARLATAAADRLDADLQHAGAEGTSTLGALYLKAAMARATDSAAERDQRRAAAAARAVPDLLAEADDHAARLPGGGNFLWSAFCSANVALYRLASHVQLDQGEKGVSVALGMTPEQIGGLPRERRAHRLVDLAHAHVLAGQREKALNALLDAEREARDEVRRRPRTRRLVQDLVLLGTGRAAEGRLHALAGRCGLPG